MVVSDAYDELELSPRASREVIDAAYRRLARKHHPDSGEEPDPSRMVRINLAYQAIVSEREAVIHGAARPSVADLLRRAREAADSDDWATVDARADEILSAAGEHREALLLKAEAAVTQERWAEAARLSRRVLRLAPDHVEALLFAAESALGSGEHLLARAFAATVLQLTPGDAHALDMWDEAQHGLEERGSAV